MTFPPQCNHQLLKSILRKSFCAIPPGLQRAIFQLQNRIYKTPYGKKCTRCQTYVKKSVSGGGPNKAKKWTFESMRHSQMRFAIASQMVQIKEMAQIKENLWKYFHINFRQQKPKSCEWLMRVWLLGDSVCKHAERLLRCQKLDVW